MRITHRIVVKDPETGQKLGEAADWSGVRRIANGRTVKTVSIPLHR